jgi:cytidylate kinase
MRRLIVAIDGPAGAGKSTVARHLAAHFGLLNLETGAMYRAFALKAMTEKVDLTDAAALERLAGSNPRPRAIACCWMASRLPAAFAISK